MRIAILVALLTAGATRAEMVTYTFTGSLSSVTDPGHIVAFPVSPGTPYILTATFDRAANPISILTSEYRFALQNATLQIGNFSLNANTADTVNNWLLVDHSPSVSDGLAINLSKPGAYAYRLDLREFTGTLFTGPPVPPTTIDLAAYDIASFAGRIYGPRGAEASFSGSVAASPRDTPEPSSLVLLLIGGLGLIVRTRTRGQSFYS